MNYITGVGLVIAVIIILITLCGCGNGKIEFMEQELPMIDINTIPTEPFEFYYCQHRMPIARKDKPHMTLMVLCAGCMKDEDSKRIKDLELGLVTH